jgi:hypothetical protein
MIGVIPDRRGTRSQVPFLVMECISSCIAASHSGSTMASRKEMSLLFYRT